MSSNLPIAPSGIVPGEYLRLLRPRYWAKNLLVFVPAFLANTFREPGVLLSCAAGFVLLCLCASATYVLNDIADVELDRAHPEKQARPLASKTVSLRSAVSLAVLLAATAIACALVWRPPLAAVLLAYCAGGVLYTFTIKKIPLADIVWLSGMHTARLVAGGVLADVKLSGWLVAFSLVFFLSLAIAKRYCELVLASRAGEAEIPGRAYTRRHLGLLQSLGAGSAFGSIVVLALYITDSEYSARYYAHPSYLWLSVLVIAAWLLRIWRKAHDGGLTADPVSFALRDKVSLALFIGLLVTMWLAK